MENALRFDFMEVVDVYSKKEKGPPILAFICREGVIVAVDDSVDGTYCVPSSKLVDRNLIEFNSHVIGFVTGEVADSESEKFLRELKQQGREVSAEEVSDWLVKKLPSRILKSLSGMLIAGWNEKGPSLYRLDGEGKLHCGVLFACGSCAEFGYGVVGVMGFLFLPVSEAAKLARIEIPTAVVKSELFRGSGDSGDEVCESGRIGDSVKVYCIRHYGHHPVDDDEEDIREPCTEKKRRKVDISAL